MNIKTELPLQISKIRKRNNLTQKEFSKMLNISERQVRHLEAGTSNGTVKLLLKIAEQFDLKLMFC